MKKIIISLLILFSITANAQNNDKATALNIAQDAVAKMENGEIDESIKMLEKAQKLDKENFIYSYEIAYAYYLKKDYTKSIEVLEKIKKLENIHPDVYNLLGNAYDEGGNIEKARETYRLGIEKFPEQNGRFYTNLGVLEYNKENYDEALKVWEKGVKEDPYHASNYYWLSKMYSFTDENIWTIFYGEIFMNIERATDRTEEISKLLYDTYQLTYVQENENKGSVFMTKDITIDPSKSSVMPFRLNYAMCYLIENKYTKGINIKSVYKTKAGVLKHWFELKGFDKEYQNSVLDMERKMLQDDVLEGYVYWLLRMGNTEEFRSWILNEDGEAKLRKFAEWTAKNNINLDKGQLYARTDYY